MWMYRALLATIAIVTLTGTPATAQSYDEGQPARQGADAESGQFERPPPPPANRDYPRAPGEPPPFEERSRYDRVPLRVNPAQLDPNLRHLVDRYDVELQPYRILAGDGGEVPIANAHATGPTINFIRAGTSMQICNRGMLVEFPMTLSREAASWARGDASGWRGNLPRLLPGRCTEIRPDRPGLIRMFCEVHAHEVWQLIVLPADHDMSEASVQALMLRLSQGRNGDYAVFNEKPGQERPRQPVTKECGRFPHRWRFDVAGMGSSVWSVDSIGGATESGLGSATGTAQMSGNSIRIDWRTPNYTYSGYFTIDLDADCNGRGTLYWQHSPTGPASFPVTFTSLEGGG